MATQIVSHPPRTNYHIPEIERLVTLGVDGDIPTVDLPNFFRLILQTAYERGSITVDTTRTLAHIGGLGNDFKRLARQYGDSFEEGLQTGLRVLLQQLAHRGLLKEDNGVWHKTDDLVLDTNLYIVKYPKQWVIVNLSSGMSAEDAKSLEAKRREQEAETAAAILAAKLAPDREGWRLGRTKNGRRWLPLENGVDPERVERIVTSVREKGFVNRPEFYVLRDQYGRVLSGRHRLAAAKVLSKEHPFVWPERTVEVIDDADAVRIAYEANRSDRWNEAEEAVLAEGEVKLAGRALTRALIRAELLKDACRPNDTIAKIVGCSVVTAISERTALEETFQIKRFRWLGGNKTGRMVEVDENGHPINPPSSARSKPRPAPNKPTIDDAAVEQWMLEGHGSTIIHQKLGLAIDNSMKVSEATGLVQGRWEGKIASLLAKGLSQSEIEKTMGASANNHWIADRIAAVRIHQAPKDAMPETTDSPAPVRPEAAKAAPEPQASARVNGYQTHAAYPNGVLLFAPSPLPTDDVVERCWTEFMSWDEDVCRKIAKFMSWDEDVRQKIVVRWQERVASVS